MVAAKSDHQKILTIQIGANDGKTNDPIFHASKKFSDKVILIEPQVELHGKLKENYSDYTGELQILEALVSPIKGKVKLYNLKASVHHEYFKRAKSNPTGIASIDRLHLEKMLSKHGFSKSKFENFIRSKEVRTLQLTDILDDKISNDIIFLQVDCEGADWTVIKTLGDTLPNLINFEKKHLTKKHAEEAAEWLERNGYIVHDYDGDCLAVKNA